MMDYFDGLAEGVKRFAYQQNGVKYVGNGGKTLERALVDVEWERKAEAERKRVFEEKFSKLNA